ncbi:hypothetical protein GCM10020216_033620 [Nonomuraea helvata]
MRGVPVGLRSEWAGCVVRLPVRAPHGGMPSCGMLLETVDCPACGLSCDRDWAAAERILTRGLLGQHATRTHRATGARTTSVSTLMTSSRVPDRRTVPAPFLPGKGQRPAGQAPQATHSPAGRTGLVCDSQHRTGFHRVAATPVLALGEYRDGPPRPRPPNLPKILR